MTKKKATPPRRRDPRTEDFLASLVGKSPTTIWAYRSAVNRFLVYCGKREPSVALAQKWLSVLERVDKLHPNSINYYGVIVKKYLRREGENVEELRQISMPKQEASRREYIAAKDWQPFLDEIDDEDDYVVFNLMLSTGIRVGGLLTLTPENIREEEHTLLVYGNQPVPLTSACLDELDCYITKYKVAREDRIFKQYTDKAIGEKLRQYAKKAGLKNWRKLVPHSLRHSFAIRFIQASKRPSALEDLRRFLGHRSIATTQVYLDYAFEESKAAYDEVFS